MTATLQPATDELRQLLTGMATHFAAQADNPSEHITVRCRAERRAKAIRAALAGDTLTTHQWVALDEFHRDLRHKLSHPNVLGVAGRAKEVARRADAIRWAMNGDQSGMVL